MVAFRSKVLLSGPPALEPFSFVDGKRNALLRVDGANNNAAQI